MRRLHHPLVLAIAICTLLPATVFAGASEVMCYEGSLVTQMEVDGLHVQITFTPGAWTMPCWSTDIAGVDVYRRTLGTTCGPPVLVTDEPLPWPETSTEGPFVLGEVVDGAAVANTAYEYIAHAVDAERNPVPGNDDATIGYASTGEALIGHGLLVAYPDCGVSGVSWLTTCDDACFPMSYVGSPVPAEVAPYFNGGAELLVYGEFSGVSESLCNIHWPRVLISSVEPSVCVLATETATWGAVKSRYR